MDTVALNPEVLKVYAYGHGRRIHYHNPAQSRTPCGLAKDRRKGSLFLSMDMDHVDCKRCISAWNRFARRQNA